jgi:hypothetical protein
MFRCLHRTCVHLPGCHLRGKCSTLCKSSCKRLSSSQIRNSSPTAYSCSSWILRLGGGAPLNNNMSNIHTDIHAANSPGENSVANDAGNSPSGVEMHAISAQEHGVRLDDDPGAAPASGLEAADGAVPSGQNSGTIPASQGSMPHQSNCDVQAMRELHMQEPVHVPDPTPSACRPEETLSPGSSADANEVEPSVVPNLGAAETSLRPTTRSQCGIKRLRYILMARSDIVVLLLVVTLRI